MNVENLEVRSSRGGAPVMHRQAAFPFCLAVATLAVAAVACSRGSTSFKNEGAAGAGEIAVKCGNGEIDPDEECEPGDLDGTTCEDLGYGGGILGCNVRVCAYDTSMCTAPEPIPPVTPIPTEGTAATGG